MKFLYLLFFIFLFSSRSANSQPYGKGNNFIKLSVGRVVFGTGDVLGYGINLEYSRRLKSSNDCWKHFLVGGELSFENGTRNPVIINPTPDQFFSETFNHYSISLISGKISYYPFKSIFNGLNITLGPSVGFMQYSSESRAQRIVYSPTVSERVSTLEFSNRILIGYRITTGYEFKLLEKLSLGIRIDLSNYNNNDFNTLLAGKIGYNF